MPTIPKTTRRVILATVAAAMLSGVLPHHRVSVIASSDDVPASPGAVSGAPNLPAGFANTFTSGYVDANGLRFHAVIGGKGRPLRLVQGWPQTWYQWRLVMPALARDFQVIAVDQRGIGLSDKPERGTTRVVSHRWIDRSGVDFARAPVPVADRGLGRLAPS